MKNHKKEAGAEHKGGHKTTEHKHTDTCGCEQKVAHAAKKEFHKPNKGQWNAESVAKLKSDETCAKNNCPKNCGQVDCAHNKR